MTEKTGDYSGLRARSRSARGWPSLLGSLVLLALGPQAAWAASDEVNLEVIVAHLSNQPGEIDKGAARLHEELKDQFRYSSI